MGIGSVASMSSMSGVQAAMTGSVDVKSKNIQNEITDIEQQMQKLSSQEELSAAEKEDERKKLKRDISSLDTELKRHQEEFLREQKREMMMTEMLKGEGAAEEPDGKIQTEDAGREDKAGEDTKRTDSNMAAEPSNQETSSALSADTPAQQPGIPGTVIVKNSDGMVIFKGAAGQDGIYGTDTGQKRIDETNEEDSAGNGIKAADDDERDTDMELSSEKTHEMVSADVSARQADRQGTVIARISGGIAVLKGEMNQDEKRGINTDRKQAELERLEEKEDKARVLQFSVLGEANGAVKPEAKAEVSGIKADAGNPAVINASKVLQEEQAAQHRFYVSFG